jgi:uncharacterized membrane protein
MSDLTVYLMTLSYFATFSTFSIAKHLTFKTHAFDLGIYSQALYTTLFNGKLLYETPDWYFTISGSFLGVHFTPIIFALLPLYYLYPRPETLLVFQTAVLASAAIPLYFLAKLLLKEDNVMSVAVAAIYLMNPFIHSVNTYDFHIECLAPLFFFSALYFLEKKARKKFFACTLLLAITIDFAVFLTFFIGIYIISRNWKKFVNLMKAKSLAEDDYFTISSAFFIIVLSVLLLFLAIITISYFGPPPLSSTHSELFGKLGRGYGDILMTLLREPIRIIESAQYDGIYKLMYLASLFLPTLFLAFYSPREMILCLPWIGIVTLTTCNTFYQPNYQHGVFIVPFILYATIHSLGKLKTKSLGRLNFLRKSKTFLIATLITMVCISPLSPIPYFFERSAAYSGFPIPNRHTVLLSQAISLIPDNASVLAQNHIFPHLSNRVDVYVWVPFGVIVDYAIADKTQHDYYTAHAFADTFKQQFEGLLRSGNYEVLLGKGDEFEKEGIILLKRKTLD